MVPKRKKQVNECLGEHQWISRACVRVFFVSNLVRFMPPRCQSRFGTSLCVTREGEGESLKQTHVGGCLHPKGAAVPPLEERNEGDERGEAFKGLAATAVS